MTDHRRQHGEIDASGIAHPDASYDRSDLGARGIIIFLVGLAVAGAIVLVVVWGLYVYLTPGRLQPQPVQAAIMTMRNQIGGKALESFPSPKLQPDAVADMQNFRERTTRALEGYDWVDKKAGTVRIPVERAIDILARQGLPSRPAPSLPPEAEFASGSSTAAGAGGGYHPKSRE